MYLGGGGVGFYWAQSESVTLVAAYYPAGGYLGFYFWPAQVVEGPRIVVNFSVAIRRSLDTIVRVQ